MTEDERKELLSKIGRFYRLASFRFDLNEIARSVGANLNDDDDAIACYELWLEREAIRKTSISEGA